MSAKSVDSPTVRAMRAYFTLATVFVLLILLLPANSQVMSNYNLSALEYRILYLSVALPSLLAWFAAFIGYAKLQEYAESIRKTPEGASYERLATGCKWLAWSLPAPALTAITLNALADQNQFFHPLAIIIVNYVALVFALIAMTTISGASREFINRAKISLDKISAPSLMLLFVIGGVLYCYLTFRHFDAQSLSSADNPYHLPVWLMLITVIIPYLYAWFVGLLAAYEITAYRRRVRGVLYKQALHLVSGGLVLVIAASIALQYTSTVSPPAGYLALNYRLLLIILFRVISGIGFALIAFGALRLKKLEEV